MIAEGEINRYLKKSLKVYQERRDNLCTLLQDNLDDLVTFQKPSGGLAIWLEWKVPLNLMQLSRNCAGIISLSPRRFCIRIKTLLP